MLWKDYKYLLLNMRAGQIVYGNDSLYEVQDRAKSYAEKGIDNFRVLEAYCDVKSQKVIDISLV